jgi:YesN/AraC family two-component response regulator
MSPAEFIIKEKIKYAKRLLNNPYIHINEVSFATGFEDSNYFIRMFKKYEGITPKQYQLMNTSVS